MALILPVNGVAPVFGREVFLADNATIIGQVVMGDYCSVWFNAVVRGDVNSITVGNRVNIQDGAVIHCTYQKAGTVIGNSVSIGHNAIVHGCTLESNVLVGMGAIIMDHAVVKSNSIVAAGAVVLENTIIESGTVYAGVPARKVKEIDAGEYDALLNKTAENYILYSGWFTAVRKQRH